MKQVADLMSCTQRYVRKLIADEKLKAREVLAENGNLKYEISVKDLSEDLQRKYYSSLTQDIAFFKGEKIDKTSLEHFSMSERKEMMLWIGILRKWQKEREIFDKKTLGDKDIIGAINLSLKKDGIDMRVTQNTLYRKLNAYRNNDFEALVDNRGGHNKGETSIPEEIWQGFLSFYLDDRRPTFRDCYRTTLDWTKEFYPHLIENVPSEMTFRRYLKSSVPKAVVKYMRQGEKALKDECLLYIERMYDDLKVNDVWVTDTHTLDIQTEYVFEDEEGNDKKGKHRPSITVFYEAKSGIITGWNVTDNPSINSSIFALRQGIIRTGTVPKIIYADNGSEFMSYDYGTRGRRSKTKEKEIEYGMTILGRLGIKMINAQVRNARAKPIERFFLDFKNHISKMFDTYTGGNVLERPEGLKKRLKDGKIPIDSDLRLVVDDMIELENQAMYGGNERKYQGYTKQEVYNHLVKESVRVHIKEDELNLMLMRSMTVQKVKRKGVKVRIAGEDIWYSSEDTWMHLDKEVFVRYNPLDLKEARLYDNEDRYLFTWQVDRELMLSFIELDKERLANANEKLARNLKAVKNYAKGLTKDLSPETKIDMLDLKLRKLHTLKAEGKLVIEKSDVVKLHRYEEKGKEEKKLSKTGTDDVGTVIDINRMNENAKKRRG